MSRRKLTFNDRFKRVGRYSFFDLRYDTSVNQNSLWYMREILPALILVNGNIIWNSCVEYRRWHNDKGPTEISICGSIDYWLDEQRVTIFEMMLS